MNTVDKQARDIFLVAVDQHPPDEWSAVLDEACGDDGRLRFAVERLLSAHRALGTFHEASGPVVIPPMLDTPASPESGDQQIGVYRIVEPIGEGGMGTVYMAEQTSPVRRIVALKVIRRGMDTKQVVARFEAERQALALMNHPNIARVLDAGATEDGRPYFVMELVHGIPITDYCDKHRLTCRERLSLLITVCHAVQHAHQKGVIHRDLKPNNILVELHDVTHVPKVIDFGIAKATSQQLTDRTLVTHFSQMIGTPMYMSPEQAELSGLDVDTRSDVYSLGVLLYELVAGSPPFEKERFEKATFDEMRRMIREDDPPRPSERISTLDARRLSTIAAKQQAVSQQLSRRLERELDWIVMKSLHKDRTRRYESASELAADIERYLGNEPVRACPPSWGYKLRKSFGKHRGLITAAVVAVLSLAVGLIFSSVQAVRALRAERHAVSATQELQELLYASDMMLASRDWEQFDGERARQRLEQHIPAAGQRDLRGFEWYYLWKQQNVSAHEIARNSSAVYDINISPDGKTFATVGADAMLRLYDLEGGTLLCAIATGQGETNGVAFSPDSQRVAAVGDDGTLRLWDRETTSLMLEFVACPSKCYQVGFSPDGRQLVTCGEENCVRIWNATGGDALGTLNVHDEKIETLAVSEDGIVAAGDRDTSLSLWDLSKRMAVTTLKQSQPFDKVSSIVYSDEYVAYGTVGGRLSVVSLDQRVLSYRRQLASGIQSLAFAPSGKWLAIGDRSGQITTIPIEDGNWDAAGTRQWKAHEGRVYAIEVTPDSDRLLSAGSEGRVLSWKLFDRSSRQALHFAENCHNVVPVSDSMLAVGANDRVFLCDRSGEIVRDFDAGPGYWTVRYAAQPDLLVSQSVVDIIAWNLATGERLVYWLVEPGSTLEEYEISPDGQYLITNVHFEDEHREIYIIDLPSGNVLTRLPVHSAHRLAVSGDSRWLAFDSNNQICLLDLRSRMVVNSWDAHDESIRGLTFSVDGRWLASVSVDRTLKRWSLPDGHLIDSCRAHHIAATHLTLTGDGSRIATAGRDRVLRFWDVRTLRMLWEYPLQAGQVEDFHFTSDSCQLICLCGLHDVVIFDGTPDSDPPSEINASTKSTGRSRAAP